MTPNWCLYLHTNRLTGRKSGNLNSIPIPLDQSRMDSRIIVATRIRESARTEVRGSLGCYMPLRAWAINKEKPRLPTRVEGRGFLSPVAAGPKTQIDFKAASRTALNTPNQYTETVHHRSWPWAINRTIRGSFPWITRSIAARCRTHRQILAVPNDISVGAI